MLAVSNTSPLRYLIAAGRAELLPELFSELLIPPGVADELADKGSPPAVREWIRHAPAWLRVQSLQSSPDAELMAALDPGEREAIQLATETKADVLIIGERRGRAIAKRRGLPLTGALGVLGDAYQRALIDHPLEILSDIRRQGFRISDAVMARFEVLLVTRYAR